MNWIVKTLAGAIVAGAGWKLGVDVYDTIKKRVKEYTEPKKDEADQADEENGAGATSTHTVDVRDSKDPGPAQE